MNNSIITETIEYIGPSNTYVTITITGTDEEAVEHTLALIELDEDAFLKTV